MKKLLSGSASLRYVQLISNSLHYSCERSYSSMCESIVNGCIKIRQFPCYMDTSYSAYTTLVDIRGFFFG